MCDLKREAIRERRKLGEAQLEKGMTGEYLHTRSIYLRQLISLYISYFAKTIWQKFNVYTGTGNPKNSMEKEDAIDLYSWILFPHMYYDYTGCSLFSTNYRSF